MSNQRYTVPNAHADAGKLSSLEFAFSAPENANAGNGEARLLYVTASVYDSDWHSVVHSHAFSELFFVTGGSGKFMYNGQTTPLRANDLLIINPYVNHTEFSQQEDPLEYIVLGIDGLRFSTPGGEEHTPAIYRLKSAPAIGTYIRQLFCEAKEQALGYESVCKFLLDIILTLILRQQELRIAITSSPHIQPFCAGVKAHIDAHFKDNIDLDTLALIAKQNKYYLAHAFSQAYGISPMRYLMKRRIDESMYLLASTSMPVYDISDIIGFSSPSHFSQAFKRMTGCTPNAYRKSHKTKEI